MLYRELAGLLTEVGWAFILYGKQAEVGDMKIIVSKKKQVRGEQTPAICSLVSVIGTPQLLLQCWFNNISAQVVPITQVICSESDLKYEINCLFSAEALFQIYSM